MKRYNVHCMGARPDDDDIEECAHGRWVEASDAEALSVFAGTQVDECARLRALVARIRAWSECGYLTPHQRWERISTELANQPAAPACHAITAEQAARIQEGSPLPRFESHPTCTEAEPDQFALGYADGWLQGQRDASGWLKHERTEAEPLHGANDVFKAERAVLDALGNVATYRLPEPLASLELARRGLK